MSGRTDLTFSNEPSSTKYKENSVGPPEGDVKKLSVQRIPVHGPRLAYLQATNVART